MNGYCCNEYWQPETKRVRISCVSTRFNIVKMKKKLVAIVCVEQVEFDRLWATPF